MKGESMATSHHGPNQGARQDQYDNMQCLMDQFAGKMREREYPHGRMGHQDEGALAYGVVADKEHGTVVIRFGKPVEWIGLAPADVAALVKVLIRKAREVAKEPFTVEL